MYDLIVELATVEARILDCHPLRLATEGLTALPSNLVEGYPRKTVQSLKRLP
jgi:hypothetical protein